MKKKGIFIFIGLFFLFIASFSFYYIQKGKIQKEKEEQKEREERNHQKIEKQMKERYNHVVQIGKNTKIYQKKKDNYQEIGTIQKDLLVSLSEKDQFSYQDPYFQIKDTHYYFFYQDGKKAEETRSFRYQNYLSFPIKITTKEETKFYNEKNELVLTLQEPSSFSVIEKKEDSYGISFFDQLLFIKKEDIEKEEEIKVEEELASEVPVLNYHFIYLNGDESCKESICHSEDQINGQFAYLNENHVFTITTTELEQFIDDEIRLPKKSILLTIDDGARAEKFIPFLEKYDLYATLFLITSWYDKNTFLSDHLEIASHSHDMHNTGVCPVGQGGGIQCLPEEKIQEDLKTSRTILNGTTAFCYPFYEFNDYAIEQLQKAGFTTAYIGGSRKVTHSTNKYKIPRYPVQSYHGVDYVKNIVEGS